MKLTTMYNWDELPRESVREGVERVGFRSENVLMVWNWLRPGMKINPHSHPFEQLALVIKGRVRYYVDDESFDMEPGSMLRVPPGAKHHAEPLGSEVALNLDVFSPIREDYKHLVEYQELEFGESP